MRIPIRHEKVMFAISLRDNRDPEASDQITDIGVSREEAERRANSLAETSYYKTIEVVIFTVSSPIYATSTIHSQEAAEASIKRWKKV